MAQLPDDLVTQFVLQAHGNPARVRELLEEHPELRDARWAMFNESALDAASHVGQREVAEYLLAQGAEPTICSAAMLGQTDQVRTFLQNDPRLANSTGAHGIPVMFHAALSGNTAVTELLQEYGCTEGYDAALHAAIKFGHTDMVAWLLDHGATNLQVPDYEGKTPLQVAQERGYTSIVELLQERGATA